MSCDMCIGRRAYALTFLFDGNTVRPGLASTRKRFSEPRGINQRSLCINHQQALPRQNRTFHRQKISAVNIMPRRTCVFPMPLCPVMVTHGAPRTMCFTTWTKGTRARERTQHTSVKKTSPPDALAHNKRKKSRGHCMYNLVHSVVVDAHSPIHLKPTSCRAWRWPSAGRSMATTKQLRPTAIDTTPPDTEA